MAYPRKLEHTSTSEAAPNPHHSTLNPRLISKSLENPKKSSGEDHHKPFTNPSHERESWEVQPPPHFRGVSVGRPIDAAKEAVSVLELAERLSGPGTRSGTEVYFRCPFHDDRNPSLRVNADRGVWYCDVCAVGGDVVELARRAWGHTDDGRGAAEAAAFLLMEFGHAVPQHPPSWFRKQERQRAVRDAIDEARVEVLMRRL
jgi:CHC2 zinc finger